MQWYLFYSLNNQKKIWPVVPHTKIFNWNMQEIKESHFGEGEIADLTLLQFPFDSYQMH
jgi:hypothetical protein